MFKQSDPKPTRSTWADILPLLSTRAVSPSATRAVPLLLDLLSDDKDPDWGPCEFLLSAQLKMGAWGRETRSVASEHACAPEADCRSALMGLIDSSESLQEQTRQPLKKQFGPDTVASSISR